MEYAWERDEAARRRGLTTNSARFVDIPLIDVIPIETWQHFRSWWCGQRARSRNESTNVPETSEFSGVETGTRVRDSRRRVANHDMSRQFVSTAVRATAVLTTFGSRCHEVLAGSYSRCCSGGGVHKNRTTAGGFRTAAIIWRTAGVAAARITTARGDTTGTSCRECPGTSTAEVRGTGEACAVVTRHLGFNSGRAVAVGSARSSAEACGTTAACVSCSHCSRRHLARGIGAEQSRIEDESGRGCGQGGPGEAARDRRHHGCPARR